MSAKFAQGRFQGGYPLSEGPFVVFEGPLNAFSGICGVGPMVELQPRRKF